MVVDEGPEIMGSEGFDEELEGLMEEASYMGKAVPEIYIEGEDNERRDNKLQQVMAKFDITDDSVLFRVVGTTASYDEIFDVNTLLMHFLDPTNPAEVKREKWASSSRANEDPFCSTTGVDYKLIHRPSTMHKYGMSAQEVKRSEGCCGYLKVSKVSEARSDPYDHSCHVLRFRSFSDVDESYNSEINICGRCIVNLICKTPYPYVYFRQSSDSAVVQFIQKKKNRTKKEKRKARRQRHQHGSIRVQREQPTQQEETSS